MTPIKVFISYSHQDEDLRRELEKHLKVLQRNNQISIWHDRKIGAGGEFDNAIDENLKSSQLILLLISIDFIDSNYCYEIEMKQALKQHSEKQSVVVPIILRECNWHKMPFGKILGLPTDGKAVFGKTWHSIDEAFTNVEKGLEETLDKINNEIVLKEFNNPPVLETEKVDSKTLSEAIELFNIESQKLGYSSTKEDFKKFEKLKKEIYLQLFDDVEKKIQNTPSLKQKQPDELFDTICSLEILDSLTIQKIQNIRQEKTHYQWYERVVVISAITLSLLSSKRFDQKKANLLIDFLTDFEENVWENALTGLILALTYHKNKWDRFEDLKKRLSMLKNIDEVQDGLDVIEDILRFKLFEESIFHPEMYSIDFFNNPSNCFLPFYKKNPTLESALDNMSSDVEPDVFTDIVEKVPLLNCQKYYLCYCLNDLNFNNQLPGKISKQEKIFIKKLRLSSLLNPYQNIICDYYNFFKYYPKEKYDNVFNNHLSIAKTRLKDIILNKANQLKLTADKYIDEKNYIAAISQLIDLLKISPNDFKANWDIANSYCFLDKPNYEEAIKHLTILQKADLNNVDVLILFADCYFNLKSYSKAIEYYNKAKLIAPKSEEIYLGLTSCYGQLNDLNKALDILTEAEKINPKSFKILFSIGYTQFELKNFDLAIDYYEKSIAFFPKDEIYRPYKALSSVYEEIDNYKFAIDFGLKALELSPSNSTVLWSLGRIYFTGKIDLNLARKYLEKSIKIEKEAVAYGNLGHIELCEKNYKEAFKNYTLCLKNIDNEEEFIRKFNIDSKYIVKYGITENEYFKIRDEVILSCKNINNTR